MGNVPSNAEVVLPKVNRVVEEVIVPMGGEFEDEERQVLMRRWYMRSKFEAVYERQKANLENEKEKRKRMMGKDGPFNSNMEALGPRVKTEQSRQPLSIVPPRESTHENVRPQNDRWSLDRKDKNRENMIKTPIEEATRTGMIFGTKKMFEVAQKEAAGRGMKNRQIGNTEKEWITGKEVVVQLAAIGTEVQEGLTTMRACMPMEVVTRGTASAEAEGTTVFR